MEREQHIQFKKSDILSKIVDKIIMDLSSFIVKNCEFLGVLSDIITTMNKWNGETIKQVKGALTLAKKGSKIQFIDDKVWNEFSNYIEKFYKAVKRPDIVKDLYLSNVIKNPTNQAVLDILRGRLFEKICSMLISKRKNEIEECEGCDIYIDGVRIETEYKDKENNKLKKHSVDYAMYCTCNRESMNEYEIYECKINPQGFTVHNYLHFINIEDKFHNKELQAILAIVAMQRTEFLESEINKLKKENRLKELGYVCIGVDKLQCLEKSLAS